MDNRALISGTTAWSRHACVVDVPNDAVAIFISNILAGHGELHWADLRFEVVDDSVPVTDMLRTGLENVEPPAEVVLHAPAVLEDFDDPQRISRIFDDPESGRSRLARAIGGRTGNALEVVYDFATQDLVWVSVFNRAPQRWEGATALVLDVFVPSPPAEGSSLEMGVHIEQSPGNRYGHDLILLAPGWNIVRFPFDDGKWKRQEGYQPKARGFDLSKVEPIGGLTFVISGKGRRDRGSVFLDDIRIE
jgi:hypothetical protein